MRTVAVTGAAGYLGRVVLDALARDPDVGRVVAVDLREPGFSTQNAEFYQLDVLAEALPDVFAGCDAVVHLAAVGAGGAMRRVNVEGTAAVLRAAEAAGARQLVFASSHAVYGYRSEVPITEDAELRPESGYPSTKAEAEAELRASSSVRVAVLRLAWVCGPTIPPSHAAVVEAPVRILREGREPPLQVLHETDAAAAILHALRDEVDGVFNICPDEVVTRPDRILRQPTVSLSSSSLRRVSEAAGRFGLGGVLPRTPQVLSNAKAIEAGFIFERGSADALREAAEATRGWVSVGKVRLRSRWLAIAAAALFALVASRPQRRSDDRSM